jgi:hypothetical protein
VLPFPGSGAQLSERRSKIIVLSSTGAIAYDQTGCIRMRICYQIEGTVTAVVQLGDSGLVSRSCRWLAQLMTDAVASDLSLIVYLELYSFAGLCAVSTSKVFRFTGLSWGHVGSTARTDSLGKVLFRSPRWGWSRLEISKEFRRKG